MKVRIEEDCTRVSHGFNAKSGDVILLETEGANALIASGLATPVKKEKHPEVLDVPDTKGSKSKK